MTKPRVIRSISAADFALISDEFAKNLHPKDAMIFEIHALRTERGALRAEVQRLQALVERAFQEGQDGRILDGHEQFIYDVAWEHSDAFKALAVQP